MSTAEIVCLSLMLVAVLGGALADWAYAREIEEDRAYLRRIRETRQRIADGAP